MYSTGCKLHLLLYPIFHLGKERVFPTGCTALSGISNINQGNFVYSNVTVDIYEMFIAALEKNIKY